MNANLAHTVGRVLNKAPLLGAFFFACLFTGAADAACPVPNNASWVQVKKVVDGDTVRLVDGRSVRLIGVNAPELAHNGKSEEPFARQAMASLERLVEAAQGRLKLVTGAQAQDHYGRTLAHLYDASGRNLEEQQLAAGLGYAVAIAPNVGLVECHAAAERQARAARLGLWRSNPRIDARYVAQGGFALLEARVEKLVRNRGGLWIELDGPVVARISAKDLKRFNPQALNALPGQRVELRGWLVDRSRKGSLKPGQARWQVNLAHPALLEKL